MSGLDSSMERYSGDVAPFDEVYAQLAPVLYPFCLRLAGDRGLGEEIFQHCFVHMHRARASYIPGSSAVGWAGSAGAVAVQRTPPRKNVNAEPFGAHVGRW